MGAARVVVAGSINMDVVARVARLPQPGETVRGSNLAFHPGGKGANQAIAAARAEAAVTMLGCLGGDPYAAQLDAFLSANGVDVAEVRRDPDAVTGVALILVDANEENTIVSVPGANALLDPPALTAVPAPGDVLLAQLETPLNATTAFFAAGRRAGAVTVLNAAPAADPGDLLTLTDVLVVNEVELAACASDPHPGGGDPHPGGGDPHPGGGDPHPGGGDPHPGGGDPHPGGGDPHPGGGDPHPGGGDPHPGGGDPHPGGGDPHPGGGDPHPGGGSTTEEIVAATRRLQARGPGVVVVTLGSRGVIAIDGPDVHELRAHPVVAVDATGAGDCFTGNLAARLAAADPFADALAYANAAASLCVERPGAGPSMPAAIEVWARLSSPEEAASPLPR